MSPGQGGSVFGDCKGNGARLCALSAIRMRITSERRRHVAHVAVSTRTSVPARTRATHAAYERPRIRRKFPRRSGLVQGSGQDSSSSLRGSFERSAVTSSIVAEDSARFLGRTLDAFPLPRAAGGKPTPADVSLVSPALSSGAGGGAERSWLLWGFKPLPSDVRRRPLPRSGRVTGSGGNGALFAIRDAARFRATVSSIDRAPG